MRTAGIVCEYNPFHRGHAHQIAQTRGILGEDTGIVCLMSGNYVQRGEPAIFDKWIRGADAVKGGADLVLELPITTAVNAAGYFAHGAVEYFHALGGVDHLCFGSECGDIEELREVTRIMDTEEFEAALRAELEQGVSYARARENALRTLGGHGELLAGANNTLGVEYLRAINGLNSTMKPMTVTRDFSFASATEERAVLLGENTTGRDLYTLKNGERAMLAVLRSRKEADFRNMPFGSEGLWSKVMKAVEKESSMEDILTACKSKRYAHARLRRMLLCLYLGLSAEDMERRSPYLRVLAFNDRGRMLLRQFRETSALPLVSGELPDSEEAKAYFALESRATDLYGLFAPLGAYPPMQRERAEHPVYLRNL